MRFRAFSPMITTLALTFCSSALAQTDTETNTTPTSATPAAPSSAPKLLVVISVDQFSGDLFNEYRPYYTDGLKRLQEGVVFPRAYQGHAATETCPGHSTILTGNRPAHTGIIANNWIDQSVTRDAKTVYCAEDPSVPGTTPYNYAPSPMRLKVPTLGGRMKAADPATKVISVAGKDRAAIMMGGPRLDQIWWWGGQAFTSYRGTTVTPLVERVNAAITNRLAQDQAPFELPAICAAHDYPVTVAPGMTIGTGRFGRAAGDANQFRTSPEFDAAVLALAETLIEDQKLGQGKTTDIISIGLSATDYIGHRYGSEGAEMCIQQMSLDREIGAFLDRLDSTGVDYMVALTADHGAHDATERLRTNGIPDAERADPGLWPAQLNALLRAKTGLEGDLILADGPFGDIYVNKTLSAQDQARVLKEATALDRANRQVAEVFTHDDLAAAPEPAGPADSWSPLMMAKANFDPERSGDLVVFLKAQVSPYSDASRGTVAGHGTPYDSDRRVPLLFWRKGLPHFEQAQAVETVDIMPTLAAQIGLALPPKGPQAGYDGRCLDLDVGTPDSCPAN